VIKLFVTDIDGCLGEPYTPYDLDGLATLRRYAHDAGPPTAPSATPAVSICSGRPYPYVEALTAPSTDWTWFEESAHFPFLDEPARFENVMADVADRLAP